MTTAKEIRRQIEEKKRETRELEEVLQSYGSQREVIARARARADALGVCAHIHSVGPDGEGLPVEVVREARSYTPTESQFVWDDDDLEEDGYHLHDGVWRCDEESVLKVAEAPQVKGDTDADADRDQVRH